MVSSAEVRVRFAVLRRYDGLVAVVALALVVRVLWALLVAVDPISDGLMYDRFATAIAAGRGYVYPDGGATAYWPVGGPALYAAAYRLFGPSGPTIAIVNLVLGVALAATIFALARRRFGARVGFLAGMIAALWPVWIEFTTTPNSELPCVLLLMLALLVRTLDRPGPLARAALSTACLVGSAYMRPIVLPLVPLLPLLDLVRHRGWRRTLVELLVALLVTIALIGPWAMRNRAVFGKAVPISTNFGANLWMGNNPQAYGGYMKLPKIAETNEVAREAYFKTAALAFIRDHPGRYLRLSLARMRQSIDRETIGISWNNDQIGRRQRLPLKLLSTLYWYAVALLAIGGLVLLLRRSWLSLFDPIVMTIGLVFAVAVLVVGGDRYHLPADPCLAILAALALARLRSGKPPAGDAAAPPDPAAAVP